MRALQGGTALVALVAIAVAFGCGGNSGNAISPSSSCTFAISPLSPSVASGAGTIVLSVTAGGTCSWTAISNDSWITITGGAGGTGTGSVTLSIAANSSTSPRNGTVTVAGTTVAVTQAAAPCAYMLSPTTQPVSAGGAGFSITITTTSACAWAATSNVNWITFSGGSSGTGSGAVTVSVMANTSTASRTGTISIGTQITTVTQAVDSLAVAQLSPLDGAVFDNFPRTLTLQWSSSPEAVKYAVDLEVCQPPRCVDGSTFAWNPPLTNLQGTSITVTFVGAQPGRWRVWAINAGGREGPKTVWREFRFSR